MRASTVLRGIRGVFPVIKEHAPQCITELSSFASLPKTTRLAIDATLLVQRLHFADDAHPQRHILGFHRLISQLRDHGLVPIMVFDNVAKGARLAAKAREHQRRRQVRKMLTLRARIESLRVDRLKKLQEFLKVWTKFDTEQRKEVMKLVEMWKQRPSGAQEEELTSHAAQDDVDSIFVAAEKESLGSTLARRDPTPSLESSQIEDVLFQEFFERIDEVDEDVDAFWPELGLADLAEWPLEEAVTSRIQTEIFEDVRDAEASTTVRLASQIYYLMRQFQLTQRAFPIDGKGLDLPAETPTQRLLSKTESSVYDRLMNNDTAAADEGKIASDAEVAKRNAEQTAKDIMSSELQLSCDEVANVYAQSAAKHRAYTKSGTSLSPSIFRACAELCGLLKVPVLWTGDGSRELGRPHEGEAMAAMLVLQGYADIVVSEDSDVLLYDTPLLRGVLGQKKLELVDTIGVRRAFFPPLVQLRATEAEKRASDNVISAGELWNETHAELESRRQMLEFALLCGTDFNRTLPGIGYKRALSLIREFKSIDGIHAEAIRRHEAKLSATQAQPSVRSKAGNSKSLNDAGNGIQRIAGPTMRETALRLPDDMTWPEFSEELRQARQVFTNPPTLYWQQSKIQALRRPAKGAEPESPGYPDDGSAAEATARILPALTDADLDAVRGFLTERIKPFDESLLAAKVADDKAKDKQGRSIQFNGQPDVSARSSGRSGFGESPFADGGPVASWQ